MFASAVFQPARAGLVVLDRVVGVVPDVQIEPAVSVHIGEGARGGHGGRTFDARGRGDIGEDPGPVVTKQPVGLIEIGDVEILISVVVDVSRADSGRVARIGETRARRGLGEIPLAVVEVQRVDRGRVGRRAPETLAVEQIQVRVAVALGIEERGAGPESLDIEQLGADPGVVDKVDPGLVGPVHQPHGGRAL